MERRVLQALGERHVLQALVERHVLHAFDKLTYYYDPESFFGEVEGGDDHETNIDK